MFAQMLRPAITAAISGFLLFVAAVPMAVQSAAPVAAEASAIAAAVASPERPEADRARDADRKPAEILQFMGIRRGMVVADLMAGGGYFTELLARTVGPEGKVYLQNNKYVVEHFAAKQIQERLVDKRLPNVERRDVELESLDFAPDSLDVALLALFYHDTYWMNIDRPAMLAGIKRVLKPGAEFVVIDHRAEAGSKDRDVKTLHRVDEAMVKQEILAAGFELVQSSDLLRHAQDDRKTNVFDKAIRGKTDQFIFRFRKPR